MGHSVSLLITYWSLPCLKCIYLTVCWGKLKKHTNKVQMIFINKNFGHLKNYVGNYLGVFDLVFQAFLT